MIEFAILLPLLLLILVGIIDMGRLFLAQAMVTNAAREGARMVALGYTTDQADERIEDALPEIERYGGIAPTVYGGDPSFPCPAAPSPTDFVSATVATADFQWLALDDIVGLFGDPISLPVPRSTGTMRCLG